jgi:hypothetical protein
MKNRHKDCIILQRLMKTSENNFFKKEVQCIHLKAFMAYC